MKTFQFLLALFFLAIFTTVHASGEDDHGNETHTEPELAVAVDIEEADVFTIVVTKEAHSDEEGDDGHGHDERRLSEEEEEPEYPFDHNILLVMLTPGDCTIDNIEDLEETVEEILENETSTYQEVESGDAPINITAAHGLLQLELHPALFTATSLFHFQVSEPGCLVMFSEHFLEGQFLQDSHGDLITPSFQEPALAAVSFVYSAEIWAISLGATLLVCLVSLIGVLFLLCGLEAGAKFIEEYEGEVMAAVFGILLAVVVLHLLPEANEFYGPLDWQFGLVVLASIFVALLVKMKFGHDHMGGHAAAQAQILEAAEKTDSPEDNSEIDSKKSRALNVLWGDMFHNFSDGVLIATAFGACASDQTLGWIVTGSILLHEIPQELADFTLIYAYFGSVKLALGFNLLSAISALLGAVLVLSLGFINPRDQAILLGFNIGVILFITLCEIAPGITQTSSTSRRLARVALALAGFVIIGLLELASHSHCEVSTTGLAEVHGHE